MKTIFYFILLWLLLLSLNGISQDLIFFNNSKDTIKCKIIKDKIEFVEYRLANDSNVYRIYQEQYDYYIQNNAVIKKTDVNNSENNSSNNQTNKPDIPKISVGLGFGLDYGGDLGTRVTLPINNLSFFASLGYFTIGMGYNAGAVLRFFSEKAVCPYMIGMYGSNAYIKVAGVNNSPYFGVSVGGGIEIRSKKLKNYFSVSLIAPIRSESYEKNILLIKQNYNSIKKPDNVFLSFGYHYVFSLK